MQTAHDTLRGLLGKLRPVLGPVNVAILDQVEALAAPYMTPVQSEDWVQYGLTEMQSRIACLLHTKLGKLVTKDHLCNAMWFDDPEGGKEPKSLDVQLHRLRPLISAHYRIENVFGRGYIMHRVIQPEDAQAAA